MTKSKAGRYCALCACEVYIDVAVPLLAKTESGKIIDSFSNKKSEVSVIIPLCEFHFLFVEHGLIVAFADEVRWIGKVNFDRNWTESEESLLETIKENKDNPELTIAVATFECMLEMKKRARLNP